MNNIGVKSSPIKYIASELNCLVSFNELTKQFVIIGSESIIYSFLSEVSSDREIKEGLINLKEKHLSLKNEVLNLRDEIIIVITADNTKELRWE